MNKFYMLVSIDPEGRIVAPQKRYDSIEGDEGAGAAALEMATKNPGASVTIMEAVKFAEIPVTLPTLKSVSPNPKEELLKSRVVGA